jgi:hypothetical protein
MRRFLPIAIIALLAVLVATPVNAGYLIIRVLLEGSSSPGIDNDPSGGIYGGTPGDGRGAGGYQAGLSSPAPMGGIRSPGPLGGGTPLGGGATGGTAPPRPAGTSDPSRSLVIVVPVTSDLTKSQVFDPTKPGNPDTNPLWKPVLRMNHRGTPIRTHLFADSSTVQWYENLLSTPAYMRTHDTELRDKHASWAKTKTDSKMLYDIMLSALERGYVDLAMTFADDLVAATGDKLDGLRAEVATFVKTYKTMQSGIKAAPDKPGTANYWKAQLTARDVLTRGHYAILYWDTPLEEVQRRAALLEDNFRAFYLLHAVRGVELPVPEAPLVAVLAKKGVEVLRLAAALDAPTTLRSDGSYSPEHDVLILSPERLDGVGQTFLRQAQQMYQGGASRELLLAGKGPKIHVQGADGGKKPDEVAWMQTIALVERFVDENAAVSAVSREGSRQLLYSTRQLPRYIQLPNWLSSGTSSTYARPRDPAFVTDEKGKWSVSVATVTGYGGPNYVHQRYLRDLMEKKELNPDRAQLLKNLLNDAYFMGLRDPREVNDPDPQKIDTSGIALTTGGSGGTVVPPGTGTIQPPGYGTGGTSPTPPGAGGRTQPPGVGPLGPPGTGGTTGMGDGMNPAAPPQEDPIVKLRKGRERLLIKAEATSWALCYYLSRERPKEFKRFLDELALLPRDLPLDGAVVTATFLKAFNLDGSPESLRRFADGWLDYMGILTRASQDIELVEPKPSVAGAGPMGSGGPMPPGGSRD